MLALDFWKTVTMDRGNLLERLLAVLEENAVGYCVVGGQAVNAYVEPLVSLDLDLAVAAEDLARVEELLAAFRVRRFAHTLNVSLEDSDLAVQFQTDPRYSSFPSRSSRRRVLGLELPVASLEDVLDGKVWAAGDLERRPSKRQKDLADIARILEHSPELQKRVPDEIRRRLI